MSDEIRVQNCLFIDAIKTAPEPRECTYDVSARVSAF